MAPSKKTTDIVPPTTPLDETEMEFSSVEAELERTFKDPKFVKMMQRLAYEVAVVGMSEQEACMVVNYDYEKLIALKAQHSVVRRLFEMKSLEYKRGLMKTLSNKARSGDDKLAQWLLEAKFPEEFNRRKGVGGGEDGKNADLLGAAVEFVRKSTSASGLVQEESGRAFLVKKNPENAVVDLPEMLKGKAERIVASMDV